MPSSPSSAVLSPECSTLEVAERLGLAVRSVQLMVDRGELKAWKTPGGHRRIARASVDAWLLRRGSASLEGQADGEIDTQTDKSRSPRRPPRWAATSAPRRPQVLLIEDSRHFQKLVTLLLQQRFPQIDLHVADDGIAGLAMAGRLQPDVMLVDILLPGIDGAALITSLRSHPAFGGCGLIVITSMQGAALDPYRFALTDVPVVHIPDLLSELPALLNAALQRQATKSAVPAESLA